MNDHVRKISLIIAGALLFNLLFFHEKMALNTALFDVFLLSSLFFLYPAAKGNTIVRWLFVAHVIALITVLTHNTVLSKYAFIGTLLLLTGFAEYTHRSAWYAGGSVFMNFLLFVGSFAESISKAATNKKPGKKNWAKWVRFSIIPVILAFIFFIVYASANSVFANISSRAAMWLEDIMRRLFGVFEIERIFFTLFGFYIIGALLEKTRINYFSLSDIEHSDALVRRKKTLRRKLQIVPQAPSKVSNVALKNENTIGIISLVLLNLLLFFVNCIDIDFIWLHFEFKPDQPIYKLVHEGTELLIISIILAMAVVLFFFKGNLNFYTKNKWLKLGAYVWIFQNAFLVLSVLLRDYYYIANYGLAYKRIGVLFFLLMVLVGLGTVFMKVYAKRTGYFLFRVNAWAAVVLLVIGSCIDWDPAIAKYNIRNSQQITLDTAFLFSLSDRTLPVLDEHKELFQNLPGDMVNFQKRIDAYRKEQQKYTWLSWNYADDKVRKYFDGQQNKTVQR